jgi:hypothetical protein
VDLPRQGSDAPLDAATLGCLSSNAPHRDLISDLQRIDVPRQAGGRIGAVRRLLASVPPPGLFHRLTFSSRLYEGQAEALATELIAQGLRGLRPLPPATLDDNVALAAYRTERANALRRRSGHRAPVLKTPRPY